MFRKKMIWLLSAYRSDSHAYWADWLVSAYSDFDWRKLELPGRHFRWRIRGNPLSWLEKLPDEEPDLIIATSMVDLATLKGLHPRLAAVPTIYYFHENQFAYPLGENQVDSVEPMMVQVYGALAADQLWFNSAYNRDSFLQGLGDLLDRFPDETPAGISEQLRLKSEVLPVVIDAIAHDGAEKRNRKLILWNHRWEYDKAPHLFSEALIRLRQSGVDFELALLGPRPVRTPEALLEIETEMDNLIVANGMLSRDHYTSIVAQASIVVSTAIHEFQGLSVLEAVSAGAVPLVPDDLCYQEQYSAQYRYPAGDGVALSKRLQDYLGMMPVAPDVSYWWSEELIERWRQAITDVWYSP